MNTDQKKEEAPSQPASPRDEHNALSNLTLPVKRIKLTPEGVNQAHIDAIRKRLALMRKRLREDILFVGGKLAKIRDKMPHGRWRSFIERNFELSIRSANTWIRAWENRDSELAVSDWDAYMRVLYGHGPKKLKAPKFREEDEDEDDLEQSGGDGFGSGLGEDSVFGDKGKPELVSFKRMAALLLPFFQSSSYTRKAKEDYINEAISWFET